MTHYRPHGKSPRCDSWRDGTFDECLAIIREGGTTDVERVTCPACLRYLRHAVMHATAQSAIRQASPRKAAQKGGGE